MFALALMDYYPPSPSPRPSQTELTSKEAEIEDLSPKIILRAPRAGAVRNFDEVKRDARLDCTLALACSMPCLPTGST